MAKRPIGFFDSGLGGISVLKFAKQIMPRENYIYFGDSVNAPYGTKSNEQVFKLVNDAVDNLLMQDIKALVLACNTATSVAVEYLRKNKNIPIISMEPAIKPALEETNGNVLLLATEVTIASARVQELIKKYDTNSRVIAVPSHLLAEKIEKSFFEKSDLDEYLNKLLSPYKDKNITAIVLGCTHYPFIADKIASYFKDAKVYDGILGTVTHLKNVLNEQELLNSDGGNVKFLSSDKDMIEKYLFLFNGGKLWNACIVDV